MDAINYTATKKTIRREGRRAAKGNAKECTLKAWPGNQGPFRTATAEAIYHKSPALSVLCRTGLQVPQSNSPAVIRTLK
jgi:hypothetical protein